MKVEKLILNRDARCRWTMEGFARGHDLKKDEEVIKIHDFAVNGNRASLYFCKECAERLWFGLGLLLAKNQDFWSAWEDCK